MNVEISNKLIHYNKKRYQILGDVLHLFGHFNERCLNLKSKWLASNFLNTRNGSSFKCLFPLMVLNSMKFKSLAFNSDSSFLSS